MEEEVKTKTIKEKWNILPKGFKVDVIATFISAIIGYMTAACTTIAIYSGIAENIYNMRVLIGCVIGICFTTAWMKWEHVLFKNTIKMMILECIVYAALFIYVALTLNYDVYMIASVTIGGFVSSFVYPGQRRISVMISDDEEVRNAHSDINSILGSFAIMIGIGIAMVIDWNIRIAFLLVYPTLIIDDLVSFYQWGLLKLEGRIDENGNMVKKKK